MPLGGGAGVSVLRLGPRIPRCDGPFGGRCNVSSRAFKLRGFSKATVIRSIASCRGRTRSRTAATTVQSSPPEKRTATRAAGGAGTGGTVATRARIARSSSEMKVRMTSRIRWPMTGSGGNLRVIGTVSPMDGNAGLMRSKGSTCWLQYQHLL
jgi:hypothetical protein